MRIAIVGAGVAGLTAAVALQRDGHDVIVHERATALRAAGFGLNLWSNATTLLDELGVAVPGEPYDHISFRAGGRHRVTMPVGPRRGRPHMNAERAALLHALADRLTAGTIRYAAPVAQVADLIEEGADLVVAADGVGSTLRPDHARRARQSSPWSVWQAVIDDGADLIEAGGGAVVVGRSRFVGIWRHPRGELCWFVEEPGLAEDTTAAELLELVASDPDPLVAEVARRTPADRFGEWLARDRWPSRTIVGERLAVIGDAAHPMLPCIGQGACTAVEDGAALTVALRAGSVADAVRRYRRDRLTTVRARVTTAHVACALRRPSPAATAIAATPVAVPFALGAGLWMRTMNRGNRRLSRHIAVPAHPTATRG